MYVDNAQLWLNLEWIMSMKLSIFDLDQDSVSLWLFLRLPTISLFLAFGGFFFLFTTIS